MTGAKSVTTGQSLFGGQSSDNTSDAKFSINDDLGHSKRQSAQNNLRPEHESAKAATQKRATASKYTLKTKQNAIFETLTSLDINKLKSIL